MKILALSDAAFDFLKASIPADGRDVRIVESELGNHSLAMVDQIATALTYPPEDVKLPDGDYILNEGAGWFTVGGFAIRIRKTDDGVICTIYADDERVAEGESLAEVEAFDSALDEDLDDAVYEEASRRRLNQLNSTEDPEEQEDIIRAAETEASVINNRGSVAQRAYLAGADYQE